MEKVHGVFGLRYVLADRAYLSEHVVGALWIAAAERIAKARFAIYGTSIDPDATPCTSVSATPSRGQPVADRQSATGARAGGRSATP